MSNSLVKKISSVWQGEKGLSLLLLLLFIVFFLSPLLSGPIGRTAGAIFFSLLMITGVANISRRLLTRFFAGLLAASSILLTWLQEFSPLAAFRIAGLTVALLYFAILTVVVLYHVFTPGPINRGRVQGAIAAYLLLGVVWSSAYQLIDCLIPGSFSFNLPVLEQSVEGRSHFFGYFSFVTLTTLGYGDITPVNATARMLVILEALVGQLYPATLLAGLVANVKAESAEK